MISVQISLINFLKSQQNASFAWGLNDCFLFASSCVEIMTGHDPMANWRGKYKTEQGALRLLKKHGGGSVLTAFSEFFGPIKPRLNAVNGDLILIETETGPAVGVMYACQVWAMSPTGLVNLPIRSAVGCWPLQNLKRETQ
jgi:hypothetical protein